MGLRSWMRRTFGGAEQRVAPFGTSTIPPNSWSALGSFAQIDLRAAEDALQATAMWAATNFIARTGSSLPLDTYRKRGDGTPEKIANPKLVDDPGGEGYGAQDWLYQYLMSMLLRGNAYGTLGAADAGGYPAQIVLYHPDDVVGWRDRVTGEVRWVVAGRDMPATQIWHQRAYPMPGRLLGMSPVQHHVLTISQGLAAARFGSQWFTDGAHPSGILSNTETQINREQAMEAKARYMAAMQGSREPAVFGKGWEFKPVQVNAEESQFLATQRYTAADCARIYGPGLPEILGYETGGSLTYNNPEHRRTDLLTFAMDPWLTATENMFSRLLPRGQYVKINRGGLLRTDLLTRYRAHAIGIAAQFLTPDEARGIEEAPPLTAEQKAELAALKTQPPALGEGEGA